jgi:hypothetical protein
LLRDETGQPDVHPGRQHLPALIERLVDPMSSRSPRETRAMLRS